MQLGLGLLGHHVVGGAHEAKQQPNDQEVGVHHPRHVERDVREKQVANDVLQAERNSENDLPCKQRHRGDEVELRDRLALIL
ncbi:hypothetical protein D3C71_1730560 [compost metagenome]